MLLGDGIIESIQESDIKPNELFYGASLTYAGVAINKISSYMSRIFDNEVSITREQLEIHENSKKINYHRAYKRLYYDIKALNKRPDGYFYLPPMTSITDRE